MKVVVIGSGPGGYPAALRLKALGADVSIAEVSDFGGTCLNRGCIPSKAILEIAHRKHNFIELEKFLDANIPEIKLNWEKIRQHKSEVVSKIRTSLEQLFRMKKIEIIRGKASFLNENQILIKNEKEESTINFDYAIIATGTKPFYPPPFDKFKDKLTDSDKIFDIEKQPEKLTIIGAGVIGLEMGCFFNAIGTKVEIVELLDEILPFEDQQVVKVLKNSLEKRGIIFNLGVKSKDIIFENDKKILILENGKRIESDEILIAAGRTSNLEELNLKAINVEYSKWIKVNNKMQTTNPKIYAVGDINGISLLAHSAERQGEIAAENIMGNNLEFEPEIVPNCIYTWPELASVGIRKKQADEKGIKTKIRKSYFQVLGRAIASMSNEGLCQIITDEQDVILGAQIVGGPATEIIHILSLAVKQKMKIKDLNSIIFAHPTMSEIIKEALSR